MDAAGGGTAVKEAVALNHDEIKKYESREVEKQEGGKGKRQRSDRCLSFMEISMEPGIKSLKHLDSKKFKSSIKRWAKAVVNYARQVSGRFGSSHRNQDSGDSCGRSVLTGKTWDTTQIYGERQKNERESSLCGLVSLSEEKTRFAGILI